MPLQNFVSYQGNIPATWLNAIDAFYVTLFSSATTASAARTALGLGTIATENTAAITADLVMSSAGIIEAEGAAVASAATTDIWTTDGNTRHITGTTTITSFGTAPQVGAWMKIIFDGALTLTHGANLSLPGSANITTAADDFAFVYADTTTQFDVLYFKKDGSAIVSSANALTGTTLASNVVSSSLTSFGASIALGTPASGTLINATGLPLTTGITGTLGVANGGSGVTTTSATITWGGILLSSGNVTLAAGGTVAPVSGTTASFSTSSATPSTTVSGIRLSPTDLATALFSGGSTTTSQTHINFINGNGTVGSITTNGTATAYNTTSDGRIKTKFGIATDNDVLRETKVWDGEWNVDRRKDRFLIAQEAYLVKPSAVTVGDDTVDAVYEDYFEDAEEKYIENVVEVLTDESGKQWQHITPVEKTRTIQVKKQRFVRWTKRLLNPWSIDYSKYVPELIAGWQAHEKEIISLKKYILELETK